jgi:hypothetical protein
MMKVSTILAVMLGWLKIAPVEFIKQATGVCAFQYYGYTHPVLRAQQEINKLTPNNHLYHHWELPSV